MTKKFCKLHLATLVIALAATACLGAPYVDTFDSGLSGWQMTDGNGALPSDLTTLGGTYGWNSSGYLSLQLDGSSSRQYLDLLFSTNDLYTAGDYISFDFYAKDNGSPAVKLYGYVKGDDSVGWINEITSVTLDQWTTYTVGMGFDSGSGWARLDGGSETAGAWASSISSIDEVGIMLYYNSGAGQEYGLDNFSIVPEPEVLLMLGFALISIAYTFRKDIQDSLVRVREYIS